MKIRIIKIKLKNYIRNQQGIIALLARLALRTDALIFDLLKKLRLYDFYLRFNPRTAKVPAVLQKAVATSAKIWNQSVAKQPEKLIRSIILKKYVSKKEKGFLLISFESELLKLANNLHLSEIEKQYEIAFLPTWQPFFSVPLYCFLSKIKLPFWIMASSAKDANLCPSVGPLCKALPFQASSWIDSNSFPDVPEKKDIDIIMLANFMEYKRHWLLFEALRDLPKNLKVILIGQGIGLRTREVLMDEAELFGVIGRFDLIENPSNETIQRLLGQARLFCALSAKEGSNIAVAESLLAGTSVGIYVNAIIGSKDYINPSNGILFNDFEKLSVQIERFLNSSVELVRPAEIQRWARGNISAQVNNTKLNTIVRNTNLSKGCIWTQDLAPFYCKHFDFHYFGEPVNEGEYLRIAREFLLEIDIPRRV